MFLNLKYFIFIYLILPIFSYVSFPLNNDDYNLTLTDSPKETMEKLINSKLHIIVNIGSEKVNIKAYIVLNREEFILTQDLPSKIFEDETSRLPIKFDIIKKYMITLSK